MIIKQITIVVRENGKGQQGTLDQMGNKQKKDRVNVITVKVNVQTPRGKEGIVAFQRTRH